EDLTFGIEQRVDFVAVSFVRTVDDIREVRKFLEAQGADIPLVAKLERHEVLDNLAAVVAAVDAVMVARGDLGVDVPLEDVPHIQKEIIRQAHAAKVPVIVATQMLESMVTHMRPTRAEVADVTAAIFDTADAIMLSPERPATPIIAFTPFSAVQRRLALTWGVTSRLIRKVETTDEMVEEIEATLLGDGTVRTDDVLVIISGSPMWVTGTTNLMKIHRVGERR